MKFHLNTMGILFPQHFLLKPNLLPIENDIELFPTRRGIKGMMIDRRQ